ncbi:MAG TPA: S8/S53 family peptidase [Ktedonobacteraceae bacterium]|nr:S8/S53 family peptidase [Ktedonobacteraceae bacterium]
MNTQGTPMSEMHNTFWRENQVVVTFYSTTPLVSTDGTHQGYRILENLNLDLQRQKLNAFLAEHDLPFTLSFYKSNEGDDFQKSLPSEVAASPDLGAEQKDRGNFNPPPGVYLFGLRKPIQSDFGEVATSVTTFFDFTAKPGSMQPAGTEGTSMGDGGNDGNDGTDGKNERPGYRSVVPIVNTFNKGLETLNKERQMPISAAAPNWLWGGTGYVPQGCPLMPPVPVDNACSFWHFHLPQLSPEQLLTMTGKGVTVFVLDALPDQDVITQAVQKAGDTNLLLLDVSRSVTFNYDVWNNWVTQGNNANIPPLAVGKDVYDRHFAFEMPDHGLFIGGIVHDIAPRAQIECIRVLSDYCVGDSDLFLNALQYIQNRLLPGGDLYQQPVVINMSLVMPTLEEAESDGIDVSGSVTNDVLTLVLQAIQALVQSGAIIVASAGNEADLRNNPLGLRPPALHPAAFANPPVSIAEIIPVGAVDKYGCATSYSDYPGPRGIATYGGEFPAVNPPQPPSNNPVVAISDAMQGIYSATFYPPLSEDAPALPYPTPDGHGWAYWIGTSFATPIISAVAARVLEWQASGGLVVNVPNAILAAAGASQTQWNNLDPATSGVPGGSTTGPMLLAVQRCQIEDDATASQ